MMHDSDDYPDTIIPLHESDAKYLFFSCLDDKNWQSDYEITKAAKRLDDHGFQNYSVSYIKLRFLSILFFL